MSDTFEVINALYRFTGEQTYLIETCCYRECAVTWAMTSTFVERRRNDHETFYCPNGHGQFFAGETEEGRAKHDLGLVRAALDRLAQHMHSKHPDWHSSEAKT